MKSGILEIYKLNVDVPILNRSKSGSYISGSECAAGWEDDSPVSSINANISQMNTSLTSLESGFQVSSLHQHSLILMSPNSLLFRIAKAA